MRPDKNPVRIIVKTALIIKLLFHSAQVDQTAPILRPKISKTVQKGRKASKDIEARTV